MYKMQLFLDESFSKEYSFENITFNKEVGLSAFIIYIRTIINKNNYIIINIYQLRNIRPTILWYTKGTVVERQGDGGGKKVIVKNNTNTIKEKGREEKVYYFIFIIIE